jgi:putative spermidine/putrescine transport system ATP-binding protein
MSDRVAVMNGGRIEQIGSPRDIYDRPATPFVADFIGETNFIRRDGTTVAVRPEQIRLSAVGNGGVPGEVLTTMVIGPAIQCVVRTDSGQEVLVRQPRTAGSEVESLRAGDRVVLTWADEAALVLQGGSE